MSALTHTRPRRQRKPLPEALSIADTAAILDVSTKTIRRWIKGRWIRAYRLGPTNQIIRIPRSEIARLRSIRVGWESDMAAPPENSPTKYPRV